MRKISFLLLAMLLFVQGCASVSSTRQETPKVSGEYFGKASYYADKFQGRATASGEKYDANKLTAAHKTLPFQTRVRVTNLDNGRTVTVKVNDRGPFVAGRIIDLSKSAAKQIGMIDSGIADVKVEVLR